MASGVLGGWVLMLSVGRASGVLVALGSLFAGSLPSGVAVVASVAGSGNALLKQPPNRPDYFGGVDGQRYQFRQFSYENYNVF